MSRDQSPLLPAKIAVVFRVRRCAGTVADTGYPLVYVSNVQLSSLTPSDSTAPSGLTGTSGATRTVRDSAVALYSTSAGPASNKAALDALAKQYAQDWLDWSVADQPGDIVVSGIVAPAPNGLIDTVEWAYAEGQCYTRISSPPFNGAPDELSHFDPATASCADGTSAATTNFIPAFDYYSPPETCTGGGAKAHVTGISSGAITTITVDSGGTYTGTPTVAFSDDGVGSGATATATMSGGAVTSVAVNNGGQNYNLTQSPVVSFNGGGAKLQRTRRRLAIEDGRLVSRFIAYDTIGS